MAVGGCFCGNVRYEVAGNSEGNILCHCYDCRKITGSTYSTNCVFPEDGFKVTKGTPKPHTVKGESGNEITSMFCGDCGSTMWRQGASFPGKRIIKAGTLDDTSVVDNMTVNAELYAPLRPKWIAAQEGAAQNKAMS
ncbi:hypothetical protein IAQ61_011339 [Plenodomus lingam]|uniref:Similar to glutathione-dependent formaldehyde-activating n=1 Tax=Leptosphaeria maculans (strain JN3 / isolate v23.1.3 / race Av1-4-5-6-7-8) TaxID=985895 RepID=E5A9R9_LEPMJ|nr:similar to glutathione-dependent formaldehyde-activating [Plenodomus lingam JN3]KAH9859558.1 hypothetical protein IAQ61_011339 [Plenodomus lingam]CBY00410.1 similar to glutathione-dependent formaldehyde-activating [Plenodomus lingam JN3]